MYVFCHVHSCMYLVLLLGVFASDDINVSMTIDPYFPHIHNVPNFTSSIFVLFPRLVFDLSISAREVKSPPIYFTQFCNLVYYFFCQKLSRFTRFCNLVYYICPEVVNVIVHVQTLSCFTWFLQSGIL